MPAFVCLRCNNARPHRHWEDMRCQECWEEARARMLHHAGGLTTTRSLYNDLVQLNWCGDHA